MSNSIHGKQQVEEITKVWVNLTKEISNTVNVLEQYQKTTSKLPSDYLNSVNQINDAQTKLNKASTEAIEKQKKYSAAKKEEARLDRAIVTKKAQLNKALSAQSKEYHKLNEAKKAVDKLNREEAKRLVKVSGLYNKVQAGVNSLTKQYNDLAIRKELNGKLSAEETVTLGRLEAKLNKYQKALIRVDAGIQKHGRSVGNYKTGFDGLGFSVAQLSREMPAFANSMQTGFMAISNNIPMLTDEINKLKIANKELAASGKPTVSILKSVGKAMFSWHTLISVGVTLLTVYGAKIFETIFAISEEEKALKEANKEYEEQNKNLRENISLRKRQLESARGFINQSALISEFQTVLNDLTKDSSKAEAVLTELGERLSNLGIDGTEALTNQNVLASDRLVIAANLLEIEEQNIKLQEERMVNDDIQKKQAEILSQFKDGEIGELEKNNKLQNLSNVSLTKTIEIQKEINRLKEANKDIIGKTIELEKDDKASNNKLKDTESITANSEKAFRKQINVLRELKENTEAGSAQWHIYNNLIKITEDALKALTGQIKTTADFSLTNSLVDDIKEYKNGLKEMIKIQKEYAKKRENLERELGNNIKDIGYSVADSLFQTELNRLDKQARINEEKANTALVFANGNAAAEIQIKDQLAEKQGEIEEKRIKAENKAFLVNQAFKAGEIAIDTIKTIAGLKAQAALLLANPITAPLAGLALGQIPLVIATGATAGAAVLAQSIPAFKDGVRGFEGGLAIVGDGGKSEVIGTDNGFYKTPSTPTLVDLPKNSDVYKSHTDFNAELENMLNLNGMMPFKDSMIEPNLTPIVNVNSNGVSARQMDKIIGKHFSNLATNQLNIDENGFTKKIIKGNSATIIHNNRTSFKGFSV